MLLPRAFYCLNDWSKMNLDLYNFHLHLSISSSLLPRPSSLSGFPQSSSGSLDSRRCTPFCHSWNQGKCQWPFGRCRFRHNCSNCEGDHTKADCLFPCSVGCRSCSPFLGRERESTDGRGSLSVVPVHSVYNVIALLSQQKGLPQLAELFCSVPVSVPVSMTVSLPVSVPASVPAKSSLTVVTSTLLQLDQFQADLCHHPDESAAAYVISGIWDSFRIGFEPSLVSLKSASLNMQSFSEHPSVIDSYLQNEVSFGRVASPFPAPPLPSLHIHVSRFGE